MTAFSQPRVKADLVPALQERHSGGLLSGLPGETEREREGKGERVVFPLLISQTSLLPRLPHIVSTSMNIVENNYLNAMFVQLWAYIMLAVPSS